VKRFIRRKKKCKFCMDKVDRIKYTDGHLLGRMITERGKIIPSRITGTCARHQRQLSKAVKRARHISLLPFVAE
jgi:small subunit ribosomal protein S18